MLFNTWGDFNTWEAVTVEVTQAKGGYVPPTYVRTKRKKKDDSIRESIEQLLTEVRAAPVVIPQKVENELRDVYDRAPEVINLKQSAKRTKQIAELTNDIQTLRKTVKQLVKQAREDEETAIRALLELM